MTMVDEQNDRAHWSIHIKQLSATFLSKTQEQWTEHFSHSEACVAPVLTFDDARLHPQNHHRRVFQTYEGVQQASPAPRFSRTQANSIAPVSAKGQHTQQVLAELGLSDDTIQTINQSDALT